MRPIILAVAAAAAFTPASALADSPRPRSSYIVVDEPGVERAASALPAAAPTVFFINKNGGTYRPGNDDARNNYSSIVDGVSVISPWQVSSGGWNEVKSCLVDMFARWNVTITDTDPGASTAHFELVIAGSPQDIGMGSGVGGVSPFTNDCSVIPNSIVYTFAEVYGSDYQAICETAAQEIAHSFGLDHEFLCQDPMTYLGNCGDKTFQDVNASCGEYSARACYCNGNTQNSVSMLNARIGVAPSNQPPTVTITSPGNGDTLEPGFAVTANASDDTAVARVEFSVDGTPASTDTTAPYGFGSDVGLADGSHTIEATAFDAQGASGSASITVTVQAAGGGGGGGGGGDDEPDAGTGGGGGGAGGDDDSDDESGGGYLSGGCATGGGAGIASALALLGLALVRRRRR